MQLSIVALWPAINLCFGRFFVVPRRETAMPKIKWSSRILAIDRLILLPTRGSCVRHSFPCYHPDESHPSGVL